MKPRQIRLAPPIQPKPPTVWTALGLWMVGEGPSPLTPKEPTCP